MINVPEQRSALMGSRYRLGDVLGRGGVADVYRATDEVLHRTVAVKVFRFEADDIAESQRIEAEMRLLASLNHPGLVTLFDAGVSRADVPYLVMELVEGTTLRGLLTERGRLDPSDTARIGRQLADTLAYVHRCGVVHRDIKPANILMGTPHGEGGPTTAKLADFGIARLVDSARLTAHGAAVGTAHYMSPEQATGAQCGPPGDVYSLGLMLIECLTGEMAFSGEALAAALARLHRDPHIPSEFGAEWTRLLAKMTSRDPAARPDAAHVATALADLSARPPTMVLDAGIADDRVSIAAAPTVRIGSPVEPGSGSGRRTLVLVGLGVVAALVAVAAVVGTIRGSEGESTVQPSTAQVVTPPPQTTSSVPPVTTPADIPPTAVPPTAVPAPAVLAPSPESVAPRNNGNSGNGNGNNGNGNNGNGNSNGNGNGRNGNSGNGRG